MTGFKGVFLLSVLFSVFLTGVRAQADPYAGYHSAESSYELIEFLAESFPSLVMLDTIGFSERLQNPIVAMRISDHPEIDEDEPCVLFDGLHHAREPISMEVCLDLAEHLLTGYGTDERITTLVNETEIWIIPMINPDGWIYCYDNELTYPYWRKNLKDNNGDFIFSPSHDGVDVNRNYDFNWSTGGNSDFSSITYRGSAPFSESEARAKRDLALREKPSISISYHTYGEIVIYSWSETPRAPDQRLMETLAGEIASRIPSSDGAGTYNPRASDCQNGYSRCWMYGVAGSLEFTVECATEFIPPGQAAQVIAESHLNAALFVIERVHGAGMEIHVKDAVTLEPVVASVSVEEYPEYGIEPRSTDPLFGRFDKLLLPGMYTLEVEAAGYEPRQLADLAVREGEKTIVDVWLDPVSTSTAGYPIAEGHTQLAVNQLYPNPFSDELTIDFSLMEASELSIKLADINGKIVFEEHTGIWQAGQNQVQIKTRRSAQGLPSGYYFLRLQTSSDLVTKALILNR